MKILLLFVLLIILLAALLLFAAAFFMAVWFVIGVILAKILIFFGFPSTIDGVSTTLLIGAAFACGSFILSTRN